MSDPRDSKAMAQALGDVLARAAWRYELTHGPLATHPMPGVQCLECELAVCPERDAVARVLGPMWNTCPKTMSTRDRFRTLLEVCFARGWHASEERMC